jgi:hypothetical protein
LCTFIADHQQCHGRHTVVDAGLVEVEVGGDLLAGANGLHPAPLRLVEVAAGHDDEAAVSRC